MPFCINKKHSDYQLLVDRMMGSDMLADMCFRMYNAENGTEGEFPTRDYERRVINELYGKNVVFDDESYEEGDTEKTAEDIDRMIIDGDEDVPTAEFTNMAVQGETPSKDSNILREDIKNITAKFDKGGKGDKFSPTGVTARLSGSAYDPLKGPIKKSEESVHTHGGEFVHKALEEIANTFSDKPITNESIVKYIRDNVDRFAAPYDKLKISDKAKDIIAKNLAQTFAPILRNYDILGTEVQIQHKDMHGRNVPGVVDLIIKDKKTGQVGIVDFKTSAEANFVGPSKFNKMAEIGVPGSTAFDKVQMQTLLYKEVMNKNHREKSGKDEDLINFRAMIPISMGIDNETGEIFNMQGAKINVGEELTKDKDGRLYGLFDTANYQQEVAKRFGIGGDKATHDAISLEKRMGTLKQLTRNVVAEAEKYHHIEIKKNVMSHLTGFNAEADMPSILKGANKFLSWGEDYLKNNPNDKNMISKIYSNVDAYETFSRTLSGNSINEGLESYIRDVLHMDPGSEQAQGYINATVSEIENFRDNLKQLKQTANDALHNWQRNTKGPELAESIIKSKIIPNLIDEQLTRIKERLMEEGKGKTYNRRNFEEEATAKAWEQYRSNKDIYDKEAWGEVDNIFNITKGNEASMNLCDRLVSSTIYNVLSPINQNPDLLLKNVTKTIAEGKKKVIDLLKKDKDAIVPLGIEVQKLSQGKTAREAYDFMLQYNDKITKDGRTVSSPSIVQEFDMTRLETSRREAYRNAVRTNETKEGIQKAMEKWEADNYELTVPREKASDAIKDSLLDRLKELDEMGLLNREDGYQEAINMIQTHGNMLDGLPKSFTDPKDPMYSKEAAEYIRKLYEASKDDLYKPTAKYRDAKHKAIMEMAPNDPRRKFYELYKKETEMYDLVVPPIKRLGTNLPSLYATAREQTGFMAKLGGQQHDLLREAYMNNGKKIKFFGKEWGTKEHAQKWFGTSEDFDRQSKSFEWSSRIPLAFSGYALDPSEMSYNLADSLYALKASFNHYKTFIPRVAEMEMLCDTYEKSGRVYNPLRGTYHEASVPTLQIMRKVMERMVYSSKANSGKAMQAVKGFLGWESFKALGYQPMIALRSHFASLTSIRNNFTGEKEALGVKESWPALANMFLVGTKGHEKQGQIFNYAGLGDNDEIRSAMKNVNRTGIIGTLMNAGFAPYSWSDQYHRRTTAENFTRKNHVYDADGNDLGSIYNNLVPDDNGKLRINDKVKYLDKFKSIKYSQEAVANEIQRICSVTTAPITDLDKPMMSLDTVGRIYTMTKNIGINTISDALQSSNYDPISGRTRQGALNVLFDQGGLKGAIGSITGLRKLAVGLDKFCSVLGIDPCMQGKLSGISGIHLKPEQIAAIQRLTRSTWSILAMAAAQQYLLPLAKSIIGKFTGGDQEQVKDQLSPDPYDENAWFKNTAWLTLHSMITAINPFEAASLYSDLNPMGLVGSSLSSYMKIMDDLGNIAGAAFRDDEIPTVGADPLIGLEPGESYRLTEDLMKASGFLTAPTKIAKPYKSINFFLNKQD